MCRVFSYILRYFDLDYRLDDNMLYNIQSNYENISYHKINAITDL